MSFLPKIIALALVVCLWGYRSIVTADQQYDIIYDWTALDFDFSSDAMRQEYISSKKFIKENNVITGIKVCCNRMYLTVPRWKPGVPATLAYLPYDPATTSQTHSTGSKLKPFPSWDMNELGNCDALQYVQSMEVDQYNRMWAIDVGRVNIYTEHPDNKCIPKLVIIDLNTNQTLRKYEFPDQVVSRTSSFLNDIVVGCTSKDDCWAYMTDANDGKIIAYSYSANKAWYVKHDQSMKPQTEATNIFIEGKNYTFQTGVDGIALSPMHTGFSQLYYTPLSSYDLYCVNTSVIQSLRQSSNDFGLELQAAQVKNLGRKPSQTDGMTMDANGMLYYGLLGANAIYKWDTSNSGLTDANQQLLLKNDAELQWPDTMAIDERGDGFVTTNRLHRFNTNTYNWNEVNMRVVRFHIGTMNYMRPKQGSSTGSHPHCD